MRARQSQCQLAGTHFVGIYMRSLYAKFKPLAYELREDKEVMDGQTGMSMESVRAAHIAGVTLQKFTTFVNNLSPWRSGSLDQQFLLDSRKSWVGG